MDGRRRFAVVGALALALGVVALVPARSRAASTPVPVHVRVLRAARAGAAAVDPRLQDLQPQLGKLAYVRWEQAGEQKADMEQGKAMAVALPEGGTIELTLVGTSKDTVTIEVKVAASKTLSRLTITKDQRIVHQVTAEKDGIAYFASVRPWP